MTSSTVQDKVALAQKDSHRALAAPDFGDAHAEFHALVSACAAYDLGQRAKITVNGSDRVRWLNAMVTNNVRDLAVGSGVYAFLLDPQGHILADLYAYNRGESLLVDTDQTELEKVLAVFDKYIIMDDVGVANISGTSDRGRNCRTECRGDCARPGLTPLELQPTAVCQFELVTDDRVSDPGSWRQRSLPSFERGSPPKLWLLELKP